MLEATSPRSRQRQSPGALVSDDRLSDAALSERLRRDARGAAPELYERFSAQVDRWVWRLLGADPEHSDIVQQVFVRLLRSAARLRDGEKLSGWVHAITVNTVYSELRRREVRRFFLLQRPPVQSHGDFVREVEMRDLLVHAKSVLDKLPAAERVAFVLHYVEDHSSAEIAELCGYSLATAKRRIARATRRFEAIVAASPELSRAFAKLQEEAP